jgi:PadR family transcriptional regulator, regulatory protein PadR
MESMEAILENLVQELKRGTLVLGVLLSTGEPVYGYTLVGELQARGLDIEQNTLYPLLRRLEKQGLLTSSWDTAEARPRKYYQLSPLGRDVRKLLGQEWQAVNRAIQKMEEQA